MHASKEYVLAAELLVIYSKMDECLSRLTFICSRNMSTGEERGGTKAVLVILAVCTYTLADIVHFH